MFLKFQKSESTPKKNKAKSNSLTSFFSHVLILGFCLIKDWCFLSFDSNQKGLNN